MKNRFLGFFTVLALIWTGGGCGTDTGNPDMKPGSDMSQTNPLFSEARLLTMRICQRISTCHPESNPELCMQTVYQQSPFHDIFENIQINVLMDIEVQHLTGELSTDYERFKPCMTAISELSCESLELKTGYDPHYPTDFSNVRELVRPNQDCRKSFSKKSADNP